jgi:hypothetical protein
MMRYCATLPVLDCRLSDPQYIEHQHPKTCGQEKVHWNQEIYNHTFRLILAHQLTV